MSDFRIDSLQPRPLSDDWLLDFNAEYRHARLTEKRQQILAALRRAQSIRKDKSPEVTVDTDDDGRPDTWVYFRGGQPVFLERDRFGIGVRDERIEISGGKMRTRVFQGWAVVPPVTIDLPAVPGLSAADVFDWAAVQKSPQPKTPRGDVAKRLIASLDDGLKTLAGKSVDKGEVGQISRYLKQAASLLPRFEKLHRERGFAKSLRFAGGFRRTYVPFDLDGKAGKEVVATFVPGGVSHILFYARDWQERDGFLAAVAYEGDAVDGVRLKGRQYYSVNGHWVSVRAGFRKTIAEKFLWPGWRHYRDNRWYAAVQFWRAGSQLAALIGDFDLSRTGTPLGDLTNRDIVDPKLRTESLWDFDVRGVRASALVMLGRDLSWRQSSRLIDGWKTLAGRAAAERRFQAALALNDTIVRFADKLRDTTSKVLALEAMAALYRRLGNYDRAMECLFASLDLESSLGYALDVSRNLPDLVGNNAGSVQGMQRAIAMRSHAMALNRGCKLAMIAALYADLGEDKNAESYLQEAGRILKPLANKYTQADLLNLRASWDMRAGRLGIALKRLETSLQLIEQQIAAQKTAKRGAELLETGQSQHLFTIPGSPTYMQVGMRSETNPREYLALTMALIAEVYLRSAEAETKSKVKRADLLQQARKWQQRSLLELKACKQRIGTLVGELRLAAIADREGNPDEAVALAGRIARDAKREKLFEIHWRSLALQGIVLAAQGKRSEAIIALESAAARIESVRAAIHSEPVRRGFFGSKQDVYEHLAVLYAAQTSNGKQAAAQRVWQCMERAKARSLLDMLAGQPLKVKGKSVTSFARNCPLMFQQLQGRADTSGPSGSLQAAHAQMLDRIADDPGLQEVASLTAVQLVSLVKTQALLKPQDLLIEYFPTREHVLAAVISSRGIEIHKLTGARRADLRADVEAFRAAVQDPALPYRTQATSLYSRLLAPCLKGRDGVRHLCIVPGGVLHYLPFHALVDARGKFVAERFNVTYAHSVSSLVYAMNRKRGTRRGATETLVVAAPEPKLDFGALPFALVEGKQIFAAAPEPKRLLSGKQAQETTVLQSLGRARYFHFAGHAHLPASSPMRAALLCSEDVDADGRLEVRDLFGLNLQGCELAVLSACDTHLGRWSRGDEIVGIERAFLRAGVPSVVASLWKVEDAATSVLMEEMYANLWTKKLPRGEALWRAQLAVLKTPQKIVARRKTLLEQSIALASRGDGQFRSLRLTAPRKLPPAGTAANNDPSRTHPAYWAAFVLSGDWR